MYFIENVFIIKQNINCHTALACGLNMNDVFH
jgi:hypothetical protein